jgi:hypothetical protein
MQVHMYPVSVQTLSCLVVCSHFGNLLVGLSQLPHYQTDKLLKLFVFFCPLPRHPNCDQQRNINDLCIPDNASKALGPCAIILNISEESSSVHVACLRLSNIALIVGQYSPLTLVSHVCCVHARTLYTKVILVLGGNVANSMATTKAPAILSLGFVPYRWLGQSWASS